MSPKEKAQELVDKMKWEGEDRGEQAYQDFAKECALIAVENEYNSLREMLFNLRSCHVIESEKVYLFRLQKLINEENEVKLEIELL